ncbi:MAG: hypothetical protein JW818_01640 [Pirellulales bacterium]|nr:hypothetical protein [Pirellulales bacterium]
MNTAPVPLSRRTSSELAGWSAVALAGLLVLAAVVLSWQGLVAPEGVFWAGPTICVLGLLATAGSFGARGLWRSGQTALGLASPGLARFVLWAPTAAIVLLGVVVSIRAESSAALAGFWSLVALEELAVGLPLLQRRWAGRRSATTGRSTRHRLDPPEVPAPHVGSAAQATAPPEESLTQQVARSRTAEGGERVAGWLRVELEPGQRTAAAHVAFCPPLARTPSVEVVQTSGPTARIKAVQQLPYGVRFDIKLSQPMAIPSTLLLQFEAHSNAMAE